MLSVHINFLRQKIVEQIKEHWLLFECLLVALSLHIVFIPVVWSLGWALPWPQPPIFTTIIEYELDQATLNYKPRGVTNYRDPKLNP
jgi:hypothetical protein